MKLSEIEHKICCGEMTAAQVFTQMKQHIDTALAGDIKDNLAELSLLLRTHNMHNHNISACLSEVDVIIKKCGRY